MVVLTILALGWFSILPRLDIANPVTGTLGMRLDDFSDRVRHAAESSGRLQRVELKPGGQSMDWNGTSFALPSPVARAVINGAQATGLSYSFKVYPTGIIDRVRIHLSSGQVLAGNPLKGGLYLETGYETP